MVYSYEAPLLIRPLGREWGACRSKKASVEARQFNDYKAMRAMPSRFNSFSRKMTYRRFIHPGKCHSAPTLTRNIPRSLSHLPCCRFGDIVLNCEVLGFYAISTAVQHHGSVIWLPPNFISNLDGCGDMVYPTPTPPSTRARLSIPSTALRTPIQKYQYPSLAGDLRSRSHDIVVVHKIDRI